MSVTGCQLVMRNEELQESYNSATPILFRETYQIFTDDPEEQKSDILVDAGSASPSNLPQPRTTHPEDSTAILSDRRLYRDPDTRTVWYCDCVWAKSANGVTDPLTKYEVRWRTVQTMRIAVRGYLQDIDTGTFSGTLSPITNSANDLPADPYEVPESFLEAAVLIRATSVPSWILDYRDKVNSDVITIDGLTLGAGTCFMQGVEVSPVIVEQEISFREILLIIWIKDDWLLRFLDVGWHEIDPGADTRTRIADNNGEPIGQMVPLDGSGGKLSPSSTPLFRVYKVLGEIPFSPLGLI